MNNNKLNIEKIKGIIFDFDGVIVDSELIFIKSVQTYLNNKKIFLEQSKIQSLVGQSLDKIAEDIKIMFTMKEDTQTISTDIRKLYEMNFDLNNIYTMPDLISTLEVLKRNNFKIAIASSSPLSYVKTIMQKLEIDHYFHYILSSSINFKSKPCPDIYLAAIHTLNLLTEEIIAIEDSPNGIKAAQAAGLYTIGYKGSALIQDTTQADLEIYHFSQLKEILFPHDL